MPPKPLPIEQILTILASTPPCLTTLTAGLEPAQLHTLPSQDAWSANDILAHLRACSDVWGGNIMMMLAKDNPTLLGVNPRTWIKKTDYLEQEFQSSLRAFSTQRAELMAVLESLPPEGWSLTATLTAWGQVYERMVLREADALARHERSHVKQIERIANSMRM
jgi:hypothetical protein